jgi:hypothetical protein
MPRDDQHTQKAERNEQFAGRLDITDATCESWAVIAAFYSALHYAQSILVNSGSDCSDHKTRSIEIARDPILKYVAGAYEHLFKLSHLARYKVMALPPKAYESARADLTAIKKQVMNARAPGSDSAQQRPPANCGILFQIVVGRGLNRD